MFNYMKKFIGSIIGLTMFAPFAAFAAVDCNVTPNDPVCPRGNGNPTVVTQSWGLRGVDTPLAKAGEVIKDAHGVQVTCPILPATKCYDISRTASYEEGMRTLARQLIANGRASTFPVFAGWIASVR